VDSLARGDEAEVGTLIEDSISLAAVSLLGDILENIATITGMAAFSVRVRFSRIC